jgi:hypothetical protein
VLWKKWPDLWKERMISGKKQKQNTMSFFSKKIVSTLKQFKKRLRNANYFLILLIFIMILLNFHQDTDKKWKILIFSINSRTGELYMGVF